MAYMYRIVQPTPETIPNKWKRGNHGKRQWFIPFLGLVALGLPVGLPQLYTSTCLVYQFTSNSISRSTYMWLQLYRFTNFINFHEIHHSSPRFRNMSPGWLGEKKPVALPSSAQRGSVPGGRPMDCFGWNDFTGNIHISWEHRRFPMKFCFLLSMTSALCG